MNNEILRVALAKKNMPQIALARALGIDHGTFSRWKRGWYSVPIKYRARLAQLLGVEESDLFPESSIDSDEIRIS